MIAAALFLGVFGLYLAAMCPTVSLGDSAELILMGAHLDVAHAPGYPIFACLIRLALGLPAGGLAFRAGLVAAAAGAAAVALVFATARALGVSRPAAVIAAVLLAVSPWLWQQSASLEKYTLVLALAALTLRLVIDPTRPWLLAALTTGLGLSHHPLAVFLVPFAVLAIWRRRPDLRSGRAVALAIVVASIPLSLRVVYPVVRSAALWAEESRGVDVINWGEPSRARTWWSYVRLARYANRFSAGPKGEAAATLRQHAAVYPGQLGWLGLFLAAVGAGVAVRDRRIDPPAWGSIWLVSVPFNFAFINPPPVVADYHLVELLALVILSALGLDRLLEAAGPGVRRRHAVITGLAVWLGWSAWSRWPTADFGRLFLEHDYVTTVLAAAPPRAVLVCTYDQELCLMRYGREVLGRRPDLRLGQAPFGAAPGLPLRRLRHQPWVAGVRLPETDPHDDADSPEFDRRLLQAGARLGPVVAGGLAESFLPPELFRPYGPLLTARFAGDRDRADPSRSARLLRAVETRALREPAAALPVNWARPELLVRPYVRQAMRPETPLIRRAALLDTAARLTPGASGIWRLVGSCEAALGRDRPAEAALRRAVELEPASLQAEWQLASFLIDRNRGADAFAVLLACRARPGRTGPIFGDLAAGDFDPARLAGTSLRIRRAFAEEALRSGAASPRGAAWEDRRLPLASFAAEIAPEWPQAQREYGAVLQEYGRWAEAATYVNRLRTLAPNDASLLIPQATGAFLDGRPAEARDLLREAVYRDPRASRGWYALGQVNLALGRNDDARSNLRRFLALESDSREAAIARQVLARLGGSTPR